jgi:sugar phosphate isomerase/epimerase
MTAHPNLTRRSFLASAALAGGALAQPGRPRPVGLELYSVRNTLTKDFNGTVRAVAKLGYDGVEFYGPYYGWTIDYAKEVRKLIDEVGLKCYSTHNGPASFTPEGVGKAIEINTILGSKYIVLASAGGRVEGLDGWKKVAERLNFGAEKMKAAGIRAGFHNHQLEFRPIDGKRPMDVLAAETDKSVVLQLDVGTCVEVGQDPVAWIEKNPGRIVSIHCKEFAPPPGKGYKVLFGEGASPWKQIFAAAEKVGGVEYYLIEQEGHELPEIEAAGECLKLYRKLRA